MMFQTERPWEGGGNSQKTNQNLKKENKKKENMFTDNLLQ